MNLLRHSITRGGTRHHSRGARPAAERVAVMVDPERLADEAIHVRIEAAT